MALLESELFFCARDRNKFVLVPKKGVETSSKPLELATNISQVQSSCWGNKFTRCADTCAFPGLIDKSYALLRKSEGKN